MKIKNFRMFGIRCFEDTGDIELHPRCNVIIGKNNTGKSTLLKALYGMQGSSLQSIDVRASWTKPSFLSAYFVEIGSENSVNLGRNSQSTDQRYSCVLRDDMATIGQYTEPHLRGVAGQPWFNSHRGHHSIVPFLAKRKAIAFDHQASSAAHATVKGTLDNLYARIDKVAVDGHPLHSKFREAVSKIVGIPITTTDSQQGKIAGYYFDKNNFISLDDMGEGVSEMLALIVELCLEDDKIFILDEPETSLHPQGLKALLALIREASVRNQFIIATHSNIVVRELGDSETGKIFRVFRDGDHHTSPSKVEEVERTPSAHWELLRELGYEFADFGLHEAWLFLEESSAEQIVRDVLIPRFAPELAGRLRTFSAAGVDKLEASVDEFRRLVTFVHLQPAYEGNMWIRADGDAAGINSVAQIRAKFPQFSEEMLNTFGKTQFEEYYPEEFATKVREILQIKVKRDKRDAKENLLREVLAWTHSAPTEAHKSWERSAQEPIALLRSISMKLTSKIAI